MRFDSKTFLNKVVGDDFLETLSKTELYKPNANISIDIEDIRIGLKVVPRVIMSLLIQELTPMKIGQSKSFPLMLGNNAILSTTKHDTDTYSGSIVDNGAVVVNFKFRPLPGVGLVIMSAFELYDIEESKKEIPKHFSESAEVNVQKLIDERMALHHMVSQCVEKKLMEREAIQQLFMAKIKEAMESKPLHISPLNQVIHNVPSPNENSGKLAEALSASEKVIPIEKSKKKESPLKGFLDKKSSKKKNELEFKVLKADDLNCPDCRQELFKSGLYVGCICMGPDKDNKVFIKKSENGVKIRFPKSWDKDNIELLLDLLRRKNG